VEVVGGGGDGRLEEVSLRDRRSGSIDLVRAAGLFILIGAEPRTEWLADAVSRDRWGYVLTGDRAAAKGEASERALLETSLPGVFAVGDVRSASVKRVASAVGEGSIAIRLVHEYLAAAKGGG
jgi:thioredoxin reductase (NADPH)